MATKSFAVATKGTLDEVHRRLVDTARSEHAKVMRTAPRPSRFTRFVDGKRGLPETSVKPNGVITYIYPRIAVVVQYAMEMLFKYSPSLSGDYRRAHTIFLNGKAVSDLRDWEEGDEVVITNFMPYARKIDMGAMTMRIAGTDRTYERAVSATNRKYRSIAVALHTWRGGVGRRSVGADGAQGKANVRYPAIVFREV